MGAPPNEEQLANMMSDPATAQALNEALDNPVFLDHLINSNPLLRNMPNAREMFRSPLLRSGDVAVDYQWMMVGDSQIALVLTARGGDGLASLEKAELFKVGSLAKGLVHAG